MNDQNTNWDFCPKELPTPSQHGGQALQIDQEVPMNQQVVQVLHDLNEVPNHEDLAEVIIHPTQALFQGPDQLDGDHMNEKMEMQIAQPEPHV